MSRFFLTTYENGVSKMSLGLNGAVETEEPANSLESVVGTTTGVWRYELADGWIVEQSGPLKFMLVAQQANDGQYELKIREMSFTAPTTSYFFNFDNLKERPITGPMTPRISPGLPTKTENGSLDDQSGEGREEQGLSFERVTLPPKPFQKFGFPEGVWRLLAVSIIGQVVSVCLADSKLDVGMCGGAINAHGIFVHDPNWPSRYVLIRLALPQLCLIVFPGRPC